MVLGREELEQSISTETIDKMIAKIKRAPEGSILFRTKCYRNQDVEETLLSLAEVNYTIALIGTDCDYVKN